MTREEAKAILKGFMENPLFSDIPKVCRAFDMAIKALEQQSCEDAISRQAAIDATWFEPSYTDPLNVLTEVRDRLKALPSVTPRNDLATTSQDCISREEDEPSN